MKFSKWFLVVVGLLIPNSLSAQTPTLQQLQQRPANDYIVFPVGAGLDAGLWQLTPAKHREDMGFIIGRPVMVLAFAVLHRQVIARQYYRESTTIVLPLGAVADEIFRGILWGLKHPSTRCQWVRDDGVIHSGWCRHD